MARGQLPAVSLNAVTVSGNGVANDLSDTLLSHAVVGTVSGFSSSPAGDHGNVFLQVSLNGTDWINPSSAGFPFYADGIFNSTVNFPARYVRATASIPADITATVTAWVASA